MPDANGTITFHSAPKTPVAEGQNLPLMRRDAYGRQEALMVDPSTGQRKYVLIPGQSEQHQPLIDQQRREMWDKFGAAGQLTGNTHNRYNPRQIGVMLMQFARGGHSGDTQDTQVAKAGALALRNIAARQKATGKPVPFEQQQAIGQQYANRFIPRPAQRRRPELPYDTMMRRGALGFGNQMQGAMGQMMGMNLANQQASLQRRAIGADYLHALAPVWQEQIRSSALARALGLGGGGGKQSKLEMTSNIGQRVRG